MNSKYLEQKYRKRIVLRDIYILHFTESSELGAGKWRMGHIRNPEVFDGQDGLEDHDGE